MLILLPNANGSCWEFGWISRGIEILTIATKREMAPVMKGTAIMQVSVWGALPVPHQLINKIMSTPTSSRLLRRTAPTPAACGHSSQSHALVGLDWAAGKWPTVVEPCAWAVFGIRFAM